jgi:RimJ/RimL family protein N-acetyltransferase
MVVTKVPGPRVGSEAEPMTIRAPSKVQCRGETLLSDGVIALRAFDDADVDQLRSACQDAQIQRFIPIPRPYRREHAVAYVTRARRQWDEGTKVAFAVVDATAPSVVLGAINVALCGAAGTAAYWVAPAARRRGVAVCALRLLTEWAFQTLELGVIILEIRPENVASQRVALAVGYHEAGRLDVNLDTGERDGLIYARLAADVAP